MISARAWLAIALLAAAQAASADGKLYASDYTPEIPDQRALIAFDGARQVMLIENRVSLPDGQPATSLGWVVPVPAVPDIAVAEVSSVRRFYRLMRQSTEPEPWPVLPLMIVLLPVAFFYARHLLKENHPDGATLRSSVWLGAIVAVLAAVSIPALSPAGPTPNIEVVKELRAGPLDVKVLRAGSGSELVEWLRQNGYAYGKADIAAIDDYMRRNWLLVAAKLAPLPGTAFEGASSSPPLVLGFPTREAIYPVALTAAAGRPLDLVLYVYALARVEPSIAMPTVFAGPRALRVDMIRGDAAHALFAALKPDPGYLTKVSKKLSADEMRQDIRFTGAQGVSDFRDWQVGPWFKVWVGGAALLGLLAFLLQKVGGRRWRLSAPAWFAISMFLSWLIALPILIGSIGQQYWNYRKAARARNLVKSG